jgi:lysophospholipase L1-like esterase
LKLLIISTLKRLRSSALHEAHLSVVRLVVAFGDSVTDGDGSTVDADHNWPSDLIRRLGKTPEGSKVAVVMRA